MTLRGRSANTLQSASQTGEAEGYRVAAGANHCLAIRSGRLTPLLSRQPADQASIAGGTVTFTAQGVGLAAVQYQWQFNGVNIPGATSASLRFLEGCVHVKAVGLDAEKH